MGFYSVIGLVVVLGLAGVVYSRYERAHPFHPVFPDQGSTAYFGVGIDDCGTEAVTLPTGQNLSTAFNVESDNVIQVHPTTGAEAGSNVNVGAFESSVGDLSVTSKKLIYPSPNAKGVANVVRTAGEVCAKGTKYAGKKAYPVLAYWSTIAQPKPTLTDDPSAVLITKRMLVTFAFVPKGVTPLPPSTITIETLEAGTSTTTTTTTTTVATSPTTTTVAPTTTTTTTSATTTTTTKKN